ncbi:uncharacterized protein LOC111640264 isoform X2 [Centruroides sculpturatus]|uniref:uncharacterized protein LOC111640264 isoform X2 n=1 Tax=Centruroides sculpturatus TaxID=218467 RepID=UPI000C6E9DB6|nr:uncharacterized protein LOC111640264 isoform X2 [Centruroides sculpturatus]
MATKHFKNESKMDFSLADISLHNDPSRQERSLTIHNNTSFALAFRIKCSDSAFKIKPQTGILAKKGSSANINVTLLPNRKSSKNIEYSALFTSTDNKNLTEDEINKLFDNSSESLDEYLKKTLISESKNTVMSSLTNFTKSFILKFILPIIFAIFLICYCIE